jgi:hypothetical protein
VRDRAKPFYNRLPFFGAVTVIPVITKLLKAFGEFMEILWQEKQIDGNAVFQ